MTDLTVLTWKELVDGLNAHKAEMQRRHTIEHGEQEADAANRRFLAAAGVEPCQEWRQPTHALDAYPTGWTVDHAGECWVSNMPANMHEPGPGSEHWAPTVETETEQDEAPNAEE